jgi:site-specific DNA recombinase
METSPVQNLRVALYARVSTEEQREGQTIDSQVAELERFVAEKGLRISGVYKDDGWSGSILARPELDHLRDDASKGLFDIVLFNDVDRLARDVSHLGIVKRDLERHGMQVIFKKLPTEKSPTSNLMVNILGSFAEFERELIADRTRRGRRHKVEVRQQYLGCKAPYGYHYIPKDATANKAGYLEIVPEEAVVVRQMFEWVDQEGLSARHVMKRLSAMKEPTKKGSHQWAKSSVLRILRNETYTGVWHYNKHESYEPVRARKDARYRRLLKSSTRLRSPDEWLPVVLPDHLRIVERDRWQRVQAQLAKNTAFSPRNAKHGYLLKGLVRCGACGGRYVGDPNHGRFYYRCMSRCKKYPAIRDAYLDTTVWSAVEEAVLNPSLIADQLTQIRDQKAKNAEGLKAEAGEMEVALSQLQVEEERILEAYRAGFLSASLLGRELEKINTRRKSLEARRASLSEQTATVGLPHIRQSLMEYCRKAAQRLKSFGFEERQWFLQQLLNEVIFQGDKAIIRGVIPVGRVGEAAQSASKFNAGNSKDRFAGTEVYTWDPNTVYEVPFVLNKSLPPTPIPLRKQLDEFFIQSLVKQYPSATLRELCDKVEQKTGITLSTSSMGRLLGRYGFKYKARQQQKTKGAVAGIVIPEDNCLGRVKGESPKYPPREMSA